MPVRAAEAVGLASGLKARKVLLIGLDSADAELIEQWSEAGHLPTFARLMREGLWRRLGTTAEVMHVSAWPSIYTGTTPGRHGLYHAYQVRAGDQRIHRTLPEWRALPPFWKFLDDAGRRCIVMDAFMDARLPGFKGVQILEYGTWTWFSEPGSSRPGLYDEIVKRFGAYPAPEHSNQVTIPEQLRFRDQLIRAAAVKSQAARWLLAEHPWDMAFITFGEPHGGGHYLWHSGDPDYPIYPPGGLPGAPHPLREVYVAVDRAIGELLAALDDRTLLLIISGDGMGPNYSGSHLMPELLHRLGLFFAPSVGQSRNGAAPAPRQGLAAAVRGMIPLSVRQSITRCLPRSVRYRLSTKWMNADIDWPRTRTFCIPNSNEGYFRVNLQGREPEGIVGEGEDCRQLVASLKAELDALVNPTTGRRSAHAVHVIDDTFEGPERQHLPDIVISWDFDAKVLDRVQGPASGLVTGKCGYQTPAYYSGNHRPNAFVLGYGAGIATGARLEGGHIIDIAPTILTALGVDPPAQFEGRALVGFV
jgi:predicted AlkP superfamily phosphohydrolase/phosphomutase